MKQTPVEWLIEKMLNEGYFEKDRLITFTNIDHLQNEAKEIERLYIEEEKEKSYTKGRLAQIEIRNNYLNTWDPSDGIEDPEEMKD